MKLIDQHFTANNPLSKIINRNRVPISYRCMPNMTSTIARHNHKVQKKDKQEVQTDPGCNCNGRMGPCPLDGGCLVEKVVYRAKVTEDDRTVNTYTGLTGNTFKDRFYSHRSSFENRDHPNHTTLSSHIWNLKDSNKNYETSWSIVDRANDFDPATRKCRLCLKEKYYIIFQPEGATLNQRSELYSTCRHRLRQTLANT